MSKYHAQKTVVNGIAFDSKKEASRYIQLSMMQKAGIIHDLRLQVPFIIISKSRYGRAIRYVADFVYKAQDGREVIEDVKGMKTPVYRLKKRLMAELGKEITEV